MHNHRIMFLQLFQDVYLRIMVTRPAHSCSSCFQALPSNLEWDPPKHSPFVTSGWPRPLQRSRWKGRSFAASQEVVCVFCRCMCMPVLVHVGRKDWCYSSCLKVGFMTRIAPHRCKAWKILWGTIPYQKQKHKLLQWRRRRVAAKNGAVETCILRILRILLPFFC